MRLAPPAEAIELRGVGGVLSDGVVVCLVAIDDAIVIGVRVAGQGGAVGIRAIDPAIDLYAKISSCRPMSPMTLLKRWLPN